MARHQEEDLLAAEAEASREQTHAQGERRHSLIHSSDLKSPGPDPKKFQHRLALDFAMPKFLSKNLLLKFVA